MFPKSFLIALSVLALVSLACSITLDLPVEEMNIGPTETEQLNVPAPDEDSADVRIGFGAGELTIEPGAEDALIEGTATYNVEELKPDLSVNGNNIRLETGELEIRGIPNFGRDFRNEWDLKLGDTPMNLMINAGAYKSNLELGGLSILSLEVSDGAADVDIQFSEPNLVEMDELRYQTGASNVELSGLANANFSEMVFRSGAGDYTLDFSGELQRDATVRVESGVSQVTIIVPESANAQVEFDRGLSGVDRSGAWDKSGDTYTLDGSGPMLSITVDMGAGNLVLRTR